MGPKVIDYDKLDAAAAVIASDKPIFMFNLIRFKPHATYANASPELTSLPTVSGQEAYFNRYIAKFWEFDIDVSVVYIGTPIQGVLASQLGSSGEAADGHHGNGEEEKWDTIAIIRYKNLAEFRKLVDNDTYRKTAMPHRIAAIEEYKLVVCEELNAPGPK